MVRIKGAKGAGIVAGLSVVVGISVAISLPLKSGWIWLYQSAQASVQII